MLAGKHKSRFGELTLTMSSMDGVAAKSALWASMTVSITRGISTNCMTSGHG